MSQYSLVLNKYAIPFIHICGSASWEIYPNDSTTLAGRGSAIAGMEVF